MPSGPGVETGVELPGDAGVGSRRGGGSARVRRCGALERLGRRPVRPDDVGDIGVECGRDQTIELASRRLQLVDPVRVVDRVGVTVADQRGGPVQRLGDLLGTASAGASSVVQCSSPIMAVLPATHSTRPTSFERATAPEAAPVGG